MSTAFRGAYLSIESAHAFHKRQPAMTYTTYSTKPIFVSHGCCCKFKGHLYKRCALAPATNMHHLCPFTVHNITSEKVFDPRAKSLTIMIVTFPRRLTE